MILLSFKLTLSCIVCSFIMGCFSKYAIESKEFIETIDYKRGPNNTIPKYLFRTCEAEFNDLNAEFHRILNDTHKINENLVQVYFSKHERKLFVKTYYSLYYEYYSSLIPGAYQADLFRLLILYSFGGIYADISVQFLVNINHFISASDEFISVKEVNNWGIQQTFIAAYPKHPLILKMIEVVIDNISRKIYGTNSLDITGPYAIFRAFNRFFDYPEEQPIQGGLQVIKNYSVKFLYHTVSLGDDNRNFITMQPDNIESRVMKKKFPGYRQLVHQNQSNHYQTLWKQRAVFRLNY